MTHAKQRASIPCRTHKSTNTHAYTPCQTYRTLSHGCVLYGWGAGLKRNEVTQVTGHPVCVDLHSYTLGPNLSLEVKLNVTKYTSRVVLNSKIKSLEKRGSTYIFAKLQKKHIYTI